MSRRFIASLLALLALPVLLVACGDDGGGGSSDDGASVTTPEDVKAPAAEVATGLRKIDQIGKDIAAALKADDTTKAKDLVDGIEPVWQGVEGTVKDNDEDTYVTFEDAFASLERAIEDGDSDKASKTSATISEAVSKYLEAYPA